MARKSRNQSQPQPSGGRNAQREDLSARSESRRAQRVLQERQAKRKRIYTMFGGVAAAAVVLALVLILINQDDSGAYANEPVTVPPAMDPNLQREGRTLGDPDAPVHVIEYGDFQ